MNKYYSVIATVGAVVLLLGAALQITKLVWAPYFYLIGAIMFAYVQVMSGYEGKNIVIRRLRRQQIIGAILLVVAGVMMILWKRNDCSLPSTTHQSCIFHGCVPDCRWTGTPFPHSTTPEQDRRTPPRSQSSWPADSIDRRRHRQFRHSLRRENAAQNPADIAPFDPPECLTHQRCAR